MFAPSAQLSPEFIHAVASPAGRGFGKDPLHVAVELLLPPRIILQVQLPPLVGAVGLEGTEGFPVQLCRLLCLLFAPGTVLLFPASGNCFPGCSRCWSRRTLLGCLSELLELEALVEPVSPPPWACDGLGNCCHNFVHILPLGYGDVKELFDLLWWSQAAWPPGGAVGSRHGPRLLYLCRESLFLPPL